METVELVIKIPKELYDDIKEHGLCGYSSDREIVSKAIANGTPLPKGHKRLIEDNFDVGPVFDEEGNRVGYKYVTQEELNNAQTIIEADKAENKLVVPISVIDKIKAKIETLDLDWGDDLDPSSRSITKVCDTIDECIKDYL